MRHAPTSTFAHAAPLANRTETAALRAARAMSHLRWLIGLPGRAMAIRRDMALLGQMSGAELADIGLCRQDVHDAAALPLGVPSGPLLTRRAAERRRAEITYRS